MSAITWTDALALDIPAMDDTHREFIDLLAACHRASSADTELLQAFDALVDHTDMHFAQEQRWMDALGLEAANCHSQQHAGVLAVMRGCAERARDEADFEPLRMAVSELGPWFAQHAASFDAGLAHVLKETGFDPATGRFARPPDHLAAPPHGISIEP